jgi:hypothetical protein
MYKEMQLAIAMQICQRVKLLISHVCPHWESGTRVSISVVFFTHQFHNARKKYRIWLRIAVIFANFEIFLSTAEYNGKYLRKLGF